MYFVLSRSKSSSEFFCCSSGSVMVTVKETPGRWWEPGQRRRWGISSGQNLSTFKSLLTWSQSLPSSPTSGLDSPPPVHTTTASVVTWSMVTCVMSSVCAIHHSELICSAQCWICQTKPVVWMIWHIPSSGFSNPDLAKDCRQRTFSQAALNVRLYTSSLKCTGRCGGPAVTWTILTVNKSLLIMLRALKFLCPSAVWFWSSKLKYSSPSLCHICLIDGFWSLLVTVSSTPLLLFGVPQGSIPGPILFSLCMLPLGQLISWSGCIFYRWHADDSQQYLQLNQRTSAT